MTSVDLKDFSESDLTKLKKGIATEKRRRIAKIKKSAKDQEKKFNEIVRVKHSKDTAAKLHCVECGLLLRTYLTRNHYGKMKRVTHYGSSTKNPSKLLMKGYRCVECHESFLKFLLTAIRKYRQESTKAKTKTKTKKLKPAVVKKKTDGTSGGVIAKSKVAGKLKKAAQPGK